MFTENLPPELSFLEKEAMRCSQVSSTFSYCVIWNNMKECLLAHLFYDGLPWIPGILDIQCTVKLTPWIFHTLTKHKNLRNNNTCTFNAKNKVNDFLSLKPVIKGMRNFFYYVSTETVTCHMLKTRFSFHCHIFIIKLSCWNTCLSKKSIFRVNALCFD